MKHKTPVTMLAHDLLVYNYGNVAIRQGYMNEILAVIDNAKKQEKAHMLKLWEAAMKCDETGAPNYEQYIEQTYGGDHE